MMFFAYLYLGYVCFVQNFLLSHPVLTAVLRIAALMCIVVGAVKYQPEYDAETAGYFYLTLGGVTVLLMSLIAFLP